MTKEATVLENHHFSENMGAKNLLHILQIEGWFVLLDLALLVTALLMIFTDAKVLFFHIIFILLTLGAFYWHFRAFAVRAIFWVAITAIVVVAAILAGETQVEEIIEIPLLTSILILVFVIAQQRSQAEDALRQSEERYHTLFENLFKESIDAIFVANKENKIVDVNQAALDLFELPKEEMIGLDYQKSYLDSTIQPKFDQELAEHGFVRNQELRLGKAGGTDMFCLLTLSVWRAKDGSILGYQGILRDITARKKAAIERERLLATEREQRILAEILGDVFLALAAQTSYETVLDEILKQVQRLVTHSATNIMLLKDKTLYVARHKGYGSFESRELVARLEHPLADYPLHAEIIYARKPLLIPDTEQNPHWIRVPELAWIRSFVAVPICLRDQVLGLLRLDSDTPDKFTSKDIERLLPLANAAAIALENTRLYDKARQEIAERIQAENELRQIAAKNQAILDAIPDSILHLNRAGQILDYKIHGNVMAEILSDTGTGQSLADIQWLSPMLVEQFLQYIGKALDTHSMQIFEYQLRLPYDTRDFEAWLVASSRHEVLAIVRDVTARKARVAALKRERRRIARNLHDSLGQNLGYLRLKLDEFTFDDNLNTQNIRQQLAQMRDVADEAYELVRSMIAAARPANSASLAEVLRAQTQLIGHRAGFDVSFDSQGEARSLSPVVQQQVLYIFKEALANVEKHAQAQHVSINMEWSKETLLIQLTDDGCGFNIDNPQPDGHYGLTIMQERAEEIQAVLLVTSKPEAGTTLTLRLPLSFALQPYQ